MVRNLVLGSAASFVVSFLTLIIVARLFSLEFVSEVKAVTLYGGLFSTILTCQIHSAFLYYYNKNEMNNSYIKVVAFLSILFLSVITGLSFYLAFPYLYESSLLNPTGRFFFSLTVSFNLLFIMSPAIFTAQDNSKSIPLFMFFYSVSSLTSLLLSYFFGMDINSYAALYAVLLFVTIFCSKWKSYIYFAIVNLSFFLVSCSSAFFGYAKRVTISNFFDSLADKIDKVFAAKFYSQNLFAKYSVLCFENPLVNILLNSFGIGLIKKFPQGISEQSESFMEEWERTIRSITFITYPIAAFLFFNAEWFVGIVFGERYLDSVGIFKVYALVALVRPAPFQALLRMEGLVQFNVYISSSFFCIALLISTVAVLFDYPIIYLSLAYFGGWILFNFLAVYFFIKLRSVEVFKILGVGVCIVRVLQSFLLCYLLKLFFPENQFVSMMFFGCFYLVIVLFFDKHIRGESLKVIKVYFK